MACIASPWITVSLGPLAIVILIFQTSHAITLYSGFRAYYLIDTQLSLRRLAGSAALASYTKQQSMGQRSVLKQGFCSRNHLDHTTSHRRLSLDEGCEHFCSGIAYYEPTSWRQILCSLLYSARLEVPPKCASCDTWIGIVTVCGNISQYKAKDCPSGGAASMCMVCEAIA